MADKVKCFEIVKWVNCASCGERGLYLQRKKNKPADWSCTKCLSTDFCDIDPVDATLSELNSIWDWIYVIVVVLFKLPIFAVLFIVVSTVKLIYIILHVILLLILETTVVIYKLFRSNFITWFVLCLFGELIYHLYRLIYSTATVLLLIISNSLIILGIVNSYIGVLAIFSLYLTGYILSLIFIAVYIIVQIVVFVSFRIIIDIALVVFTYVKIAVYFMLKSLIISVVAVILTVLKCVKFSNEVRKLICYRVTIFFEFCELCQVSNKHLQHSRGEYDDSLKCCVRLNWSRCLQYARPDPVLIVIEFLVLCSSKMAKERDKFRFFM